MLAVGATAACSVGWVQSVIRDETGEGLLTPLSRELGASARGRLSELGAGALVGLAGEQEEYTPEQLVRVAPTTSPTVIEFELATSGS